MTRITTALIVAATLILFAATNLPAGEPPTEVRDWLKFSAGAWEVQVKDGNGDIQAGTDTAELAAGGAALLTKGKQIGTGHDFIAVQAWEAGSKKLVSNWYSSQGTYARAEFEVGKSEVKGTVKGMDHEGAVFVATETIKKIDENTTETTFEGELGGNPISFTLIAKRKK